MRYMCVIERSTDILGLTTIPNATVQESMLTKSPTPNGDNTKALQEMNVVAL